MPDACEKVFSDIKHNSDTSVCVMGCSPHVVNLNYKRQALAKVSYIRSVWCMSSKSRDLVFLLFFFRISSHMLPW